MTSATQVDLLAEMARARDRTLALVEPLSIADIERVHVEFMSPLAWDLGHIAAYEDLWLSHRYADVPLLRPDLAGYYDAFESPRAIRGELPTLGYAECLDYLARVRERTCQIAEQRGLGDGVLHEMVLRHEYQHAETMAQAVNLAGLEYDTSSAREAPCGNASYTGLEMATVEAGPFEMGAPDSGFAYDNERPRFSAEVPAFEIGKTPVTNAAFKEFVETGGYSDDSLWSAGGKVWRDELGAQRPLYWTGGGAERAFGCKTVELDPAKPVSHVSWWEAEAFSRFAGGRLPTEAEWEKAAAWDPQASRSRWLPWGDSDPDPGLANLDRGYFGTTPVGAFDGGVSASGCLGMVGDLWEWTATEFDGYAGFRARPYREYSEVFFQQGYRVLRGGSWASSSRTVSNTVRNWDLPQRRQIFAGFRLARDCK